MDYSKNYHTFSLGGYSIVVNYKPYICHTTGICNICFQCEYMLTTWENIYDLKHPHPVHTNKYAVSQGIYHETEFHF